MRPGSSKLKDSMGGSSNRKRPYGILLFLALGAAVLSVVLLNKMRERRVFGLLLQDRDQQILALQLLLQKEQDHSKEIKRKLDDMKAKTFTLKTQKMELANRLEETQVTSSYLRRIQKEMEIALQEKQNQINALMEKEAESIKESLRVATLTGLLKEKEAEIEEMKHRQMNPNPPEHNNETSSRNDTSNGNVTTEADKHEATTQNEPVEQLSNSRGGKDLSKDEPVKEANGIAEKQEENKPREGQWVKFKTNTEDEGMADEDDNNADKDARDMDKEQLMKIKDTQGRQPETEVSEISQGGMDSEAKDGESKGVQTKEERVLEDRDLERQEKPHYGNEQQAASTEPKRVVEGNDPKMRHRHRRRNKTKNRKQKRDEPERSNDGHPEDSGKNEGMKDEKSEDEEGSALNKNLSEMPESSETIKKTAETGQKDDKNASGDDVNDGKSVMTSDSGYGEDTSKSKENGETSDSDDSINKTESNIGLEDKNQKTVSGQIGLQNSVLSKDSDSTTTDKSLPRREIEAKEEIIASNKQKLQKSQDSDENENFREHEDDPNEIAKTDEGTEVTSAEGLSDKHDSSHGDEDKSIVSSNSGEGDATVNLKKTLNSNDS